MKQRLKDLRFPNITLSWSYRNRYRIRAADFSLHEAA